MRRWRRTRKPSHSSRGGLLDNQVSVLIHCADAMDVSNLAGTLLLGGCHRLTGVVRIIKVGGRR